MEKRQIGLEKFWRILLYEYNRSLGTDGSYESALEGDLYPLDTQFCMQYLPDSGWFLLQASGSVICRVIEGGELRD